MKKIPCPCKGIWRNLKGTHTVQDSSLRVLVEEKKMSSLRRFIGVPSYCSAESAGREAGNIYSRVMKIMFP